YVGLGPSLSVLKGRAEARLLVRSSPRGGTPLGQGTIRLTGATLRVAGLGQPLTGATIEIAGMPDYVTYNGAGTVAGAPVRFRGDSLPRPAPRFRLAVHAEPAGLAPIRAAFPHAKIPGQLAARGTVTLDVNLRGEDGKIAA